MKFLIQRTSSATVKADNEITGQIGKGLLIFIGIRDSDTEETADKMLKKAYNLRIFSDNEGKTNLSLCDVNGGLLLISQFTLYANCKKGNRPSFFEAGSPEHAEKLYNYINEIITNIGTNNISFSPCQLDNKQDYTVSLEKHDNNLHFNFSIDDFYLYQLERCVEFQCLSSSVRSQIRKAISLLIEYSQNSYLQAV